MHEVDYLWVGEETNTGDAIAMRFTDPESGIRRIVIIDGGFAETGARMVEHVQTYYGTSTVDLVVCTHSDDDHIKGLFTVIEQLSVRKLLIHRPANFGYGRDHDVKADQVEDLVDLAASRGVAVEGLAFAGTSYFGGALTIAGPTQDYYVELLAEQKRTSGSSSAAAQLAHAVKTLASTIGSTIRNVLTDPGETMTGDNGGTTPRNNSSIILDLQVETKRVLFTGDAGAPALHRAADELDRLGRSLSPIDLFDVPHHGSRHNLTPELLDRLLGPRSGDARGLAIASVAAKAFDHPRPEVANALKRRGYPVFCTRGVSLWWKSDDAPGRWQYGGSALPLEWMDETSQHHGAA